MNKTRRLIITAAMVALCSVWLGAQKSAGNYLESIGKEFNAIQQKSWQYTRAAAHGKSARKIDNNRRQLVTSINTAINRIQGMGDFEGNTRLRDSALSFLKVHYAVINEDYAKLMDMEEISDQSYDAMEAYMLAREKANEKLYQAGIMVDKEYSKFAADNNIQLIHSESKLSKNMEIANKVYDHYNEVYLVFFKSYKQEAYLLAAMDKSDVNGLEQNKNALIKTSAEGIEKLKTFKAYENDQSIKKACNEMLEFYNEEAGKKMADIAAFYVAKENFEKIKSSFESKTADKRTPKDYDQYNAAVNDYNNASNSFNKINQELNNKRNALIQNWNNTADRFTDKHVPDN